MSPAARSQLSERLDRRVGAKTAAALEKAFGLTTVGDLLRHYPRRYAERGALTDLASLPLDEHATVLARVVEVRGRRMQNRPGWILQVTVGDGRRSLALAFFHKNGGLHRKREEQLAVGTVALFSGKVGRYRQELQLVNPEFHVLSADSADDVLGAGSLLGDGATLDDGPLLGDSSSGGGRTAIDEAAALADRPIPIYASSAGIQSWEIAKAVQVLVRSMDELDDPLPDRVRDRHGLIGLTQALRQVHDPATIEQADQARHRLRFEEAFVLQAALLRRRARAMAQPAAPRVARSGGILAAFDDRLPFALTQGQREVGDQIAADLARPHPMHRLLQGEVGSGKTVVALRAMLEVVDSGGQAALLAPTEVLAAQHARSITAMLGDLAEGGLLGGSEIGTRVALLTGSLSAPARRRALLQAASGEAGIVIGTHALLQEKVQFADLGLVVVDEQHRFGVEQRDALRGKGSVPPHLLVMTATPIPRTVAMTVFGDLETSTLSEVPAGRQAIVTHVVPDGRPEWVARVWQRLREEVDGGHQAFVVCPRIGDDSTGDGETPGGAGSRAVDDSDGLVDGGPDDPDDGTPRPPGAAAVEVLAHLETEPALAGVRLGLLHGRLPAEVRDEVMARFVAGDIDVLVATTVIEVGVDVPRATAMVVLDADRFGISQLHQLRGRVGRGTAAGVALLVSGAPDGTPAAQRLAAVAATADGFELARADLDQRREGDVLGSAQSGLRSSLRLLRVLRDEELIATARTDAAPVIDEDPDLAAHPALARSIEIMVGAEREEYLDRG